MGVTDSGDEFVFYGLIPKLIEHKGHAHESRSTMSPEEIEFRSKSRSKPAHFAQLESEENVNPIELEPEENEGKAASGGTERILKPEWNSAHERQLVEQYMKKNIRELTGASPNELVNKTLVVLLPFRSGNETVFKPLLVRVNGTHHGDDSIVDHNLDHLIEQKEEQLAQGDRDPLRDFARQDLNVSELIVDPSAISELDTREVHNTKSPENEQLEPEQLTTESTTEAMAESTTVKLSEIIDPATDEDTKGADGEKDGEEVQDERLGRRQLDETQTEPDFDRDAFTVPPDTPQVNWPGDDEDSDNGLANRTNRGDSLAGDVAKSYYEVKDSTNATELVDVVPASTRIAGNSRNRGASYVIHMISEVSVQRR